MPFNTNVKGKSQQNCGEVVIDSLLIEGARKLFADNLFDLVRRCYCEANKDYLQKQIQIASEYLTEDQKIELRQKGILT